MLASVQGELELRLISLGAGISRFGDREWCYRLVNGSDRSYWYVASDESCGGPSYWVLVSKKGKIERESPWWCGQGLRIVELPPLHGVDFSERNRWIEDATGVEVTISLDEQWTEEGETIVLTAERVPGNSPGSGG